MASKGPTRLVRPLRESPRAPSSDWAAIDRLLDLLAEIAVEAFSSDPSERIIGLDQLCPTSRSPRPRPVSGGIRNSSAGGSSQDSSAGGSEQLPGL